MSAQERRISPRKECAIPVRFRIVKNGAGASDSSIRLTESARGAMTQAHFGTMEGETVNLSERGLYFVSSQEVTVGQELEMYLTLPSELTGRGSEKVRCTARIVHTESVGRRGMTGAGAVVDLFEPLTSPRNWDN
jgi:hypothetical protein